ncbi:MAG TPA: tetratricopeptide repeat protein [Candidatus Krumholzibacteria bacterium]
MLFSLAAATPLRAQSSLTADAALDSARTAAAADRHDEAIRWYRRAIALQPSLESEIGVELGHQYTWADKPDSAVTFYRAYLATHPQDIDAEIGLGRALAWSGHHKDAIATYEAALPHAGDRANEVRVGIARVKSWQDNHEAAYAEYEAVLASDPRNLDALLGRAQVLNWAGRHRDARDAYFDIRNAYPDNADARQGFAAAQYWQGRVDLALATIRGGEQTPAAIALKNEFERSVSPDASYLYEQNKDTDDIERRMHTVDAGFYVDELTRIGAQYGHGNFEQPGRPEVSRNWLGAVWRERFDESWAVNATAGWQWNSFDRDALGPESFWKDDFDLFTVDGYATWTPRDWMRWDFGLFHGSLTNPDAIFRGISLTELSAGLDYRFRSNLMLASAAALTFYSDDNTRVGLDERLVWQPLWKLPTRLNHRFSLTTGLGYFGFSHTRDNGYYDPRQYLSIYEEGALDMTLHRRVRGHVSGRIGFDRENGDDWFDVGRFDISGTFVLHPRFTLTAGYYNSNSRLDSREGYAADGFYVGLDYVHHD